MDEREKDGKNGIVNDEVMMKRKLRRRDKGFRLPTTDSSSELLGKAWLSLSLLDEIQRIKAGNPDITHREAFSAAAKNEYVQLW
ncbi:hypothetical protein ACLOJK_015698 [Asimina triloba]